MRKKLQHAALIILLGFSTAVESSERIFKFKDGIITTQDMCSIKIEFYKTHETHILNLATMNEVKLGRNVVEIDTGKIRLRIRVNSSLMLFKFLRLAREYCIS